MGYNIGKDNPMYGKSAWCRGIPCSEETKRKISIAVSGKKNHFYGRKHTGETRQKISRVLKDMRERGLYVNGMLGRHHTLESRKIMSEKRKGKTLSVEHRRKISIAHIGKVYTLETRKKMSDAKKGKKLSPEHRKKISEWSKNRRHSLETRKKMSISGKGKKKPDGFGEKISLIKKRLYASGKLVAWNKGKECIQLAGKNNPMWNGGTARTMYGSGWNGTKRELVRDRFNRVCVMCFEPENGMMLDVHHIDGKRSDHSLENLVPLHRKCHSSIKPNRSHNYWKGYFHDIMGVLYGNA